MYDVDFSILTENLGFIYRGIKMTLFICLISAVSSFLIGSFIFFLRWGNNKSLNKASRWFVEFIRNTPLLLQLYILYKGFPQIGIVLSSEWCGIIALSVYTGVYISETLRSGANSIQPEQKNASFSLGLNDFQTFAYIIYPQAVRSVIIPLGSQFINMIKNSTLVSFIAVTDIFYVVSQGISDYFRVIEFMLLGVVLYCTFTGIVAFITNFLEYKYKIRLSEVS